MPRNRSSSDCFLQGAFRKIFSCGSAPPVREKEHHFVPVHPLALVPPQPYLSTSNAYPKFDPETYSYRSRRSRSPHRYQKLEDEYFRTSYPEKQLALRPRSPHDRRYTPKTPTTDMQYTPGLSYMYPSLPALSIPAAGQMILADPALSPLPISAYLSIQVAPWLSVDWDIREDPARTIWTPTTFPAVVVRDIHVTIIQGQHEKKSFYISPKRDWHVSRLLTEIYNYFQETLSDQEFRQFCKEYDDGAERLYAAAKGRVLVEGGSPAANWRHGYKRVDTLGVHTRCIAACVQHNVMYSRWELYIRIS